ncbi:DUF1249 domain-containing protein [Idiomarina sp. OT37-5b]|uniref:DUF1249 domain-containing protein n=1 Tax=Idiomarina sp. OT37-5b TaxID=2100422 RepID=UPI000CFA2277|nr:DUF1249 domain-containing protein [Idiomarina sp. OT37-5b]AVJ56550.1 DUF1249 domain-containing protein [Idiomarina sp. OT37-5b]
MSHQQQYQVDVAALHRLHERNYAGLVNLLPETSAITTIVTGNYLSFDLRITSESRYTTDIEITQQPGHWAADYLRAKLEVRLYHDVRMAEVMASQGVRRLAVHYQQPNPAMRHRDEKHQVNQFLADWLWLCREQGQVKTGVADKFLPHGFK